MNVIISNERQSELETLDIEVIKSINGVYSADELVEMFSNFFFGRMILDLTAIKDYKDIRNLQKFALSLDVEKLIILLPDTPECLTPSFLSRIISIGIYNFTTNLDGVRYLLNNPNTYRDVAHLHQIDKETQPVNNQPSGVNNNYSNDSNLMYNQSYILGIKNITPSAGSTMLIYMLKKEIINRGKSCIALEVTKRDFMFLNDKDMLSIDKDKLAEEIIKHRDVNVILIDLNNDGDDSLCNDVLYLLEPSTIKLNRLMLSNRNIFEKLSGRKIVINKNLLSSGDIQELEYEGKFKVFFAVPPLDERVDNSQILGDLLTRLGI